jgi:hypothetical protein
MEVIVDGGALAQEFGVDRHAEVLARLEARGFLERRDHRFAHAAGKERAADHDRMAGVLAQALADLLADARTYCRSMWPLPRLGVPTQMIERSVKRTGFLDVGRRAQAPFEHLFLDDLAQVLLDDRAAAGVDQVHLGLLRVHADDFVTFARQAPGAHGPDVTKAHDADLHPQTLRCSLRGQHGPAT